MSLLNTGAEITRLYLSVNIALKTGMTDLAEATQADSIMDRIIHNSYTIPTTDNNLRKTV